MNQSGQKQSIGEQNAQGIYRHSATHASEYAELAFGEQHLLSQ